MISFLHECLFGREKDSTPTQSTTKPSPPPTIITPTSKIQHQSPQSLNNISSTNQIQRPTTTSRVTKSTVETPIKRVLITQTSSLKRIFKILYEAKRCGDLSSTFTSITYDKKFQSFETLGDSLLGHLACEIIFKLHIKNHFDISPGFTHDHKSTMVCNETLELIFNKAGLDTICNRKGGGKADFMEAMIGEIYYTKKMERFGVVLKLLMFVLTTYVFPDIDPSVIFNIILELELLKSKKQENIVYHVPNIKPELHYQEVIIQSPTKKPKEIQKQTLIKQPITKVTTKKMKNSKKLKKCPSIPNQTKKGIKIGVVLLH